MSKTHDCNILVRPGLTEKAIADVLRSRPTPAFIRLLAEMLDPPVMRMALKIQEKEGPDTTTRTGKDKKTRYYRLEPYRLKPHYRLKLIKPRGAPKQDDGRMLEVGEFMVRRIDDEGAKFEVAAHEACETFGVGRTYATDALEAWRIVRKNESPHK
jgi:hypothetical protein